MVGVQNYHDITTRSTRRSADIRHNLIWLAFLFVLPTLLGILLAVVLDREMRGLRFTRPRSTFRSSCPWPSSASSGSCSTPDQGLLNAVFYDKMHLFGQPVDWYGDPSINLWSVPGRYRLAAHRLHHAALPAGLKSVDHTLREAAAVDGANETQTFFKVVFLRCGRST
ncbi:MAG: hypothetical protein R2734_13775 [Nocardioides sp.]